MANTEEEQLEALLNEYWKLRCDVAGKQSVKDIVVAVHEGRSLDNLFQRFHGGADFDLLQTLKTLAEAATLLKTCLDVYKTIRSKSRRKPTATELDKEVRATMVFDRVKEPAVTDKFGSIVTRLTEE
jgi:hypothetical protein